MLDQEEVDGLNDILIAHRRRLNYLHKQQERLGDYTPPHIAIDSEDERNAISKIKDQLRLGGVEVADDPIDQAIEPNDATAADAAREAMLHSYLDRMSPLLLSHGLRQAHVRSEVWGIARTLTANIMHRLDKQRQVQVIRFLSEEQLIRRSFHLVDLRRLDLRDANLSGLDLAEVDLTETNLHGAKLFGSKLTKADLHNADLSEAKLGGATLIEANLYGAKLIKANLLAVKLIGASIGLADLTGAELISSNLQNAELIGAKLIGANVSGANFTGAHLGYVDFTDSNVTREQLATAKSIEMAILPSNLI
jgi:uncharacterized protein YjbI with pentapeptide repeats